MGVGLVIFAMIRGLWTNVVRRYATGVAWSAGLMTYCFAYNLQWYVAPLLAVALTSRLVVVRDGVTAAADGSEEHRAPVLATTR